MCVCIYIYTYTYTYTYINIYEALGVKGEGCEYLQILAFTSWPRGLDS